MKSAATCSATSAEAEDASQENHTSENAVSWLSRHRRRLSEIGIGHAVYASFNWVFDNILYVWVVHRLGLLAGGLVMTLSSLTQCAATLVLYERMRLDWVGAGSLAHLAALLHPSWWQRILIRAMKRGKAFIFVALCIFQDPFITTAYLRQGRFDGLRTRDWLLFLASVVVSNTYWTLRSGAVATLLVGAWRWLGHS